MKFIGNILPVDGYYILQKGYMPEGYAKSLTHLYQPLIGINAISLYQTLLHELDLQQESEPQTHHTLMNYLNLPLDDIYRARIKLEGIGLLKTYEYKTDKNDVYTYELISPFAPHGFFKDAMLSQLLYHHVGQDKFEMLKNNYVHTIDTQKGNNITASFSDVFHTFQPQFEDAEQIESDTEKDIVSLNFSWMKQMLKQRMIPEKDILTAENKKLLTQMMVLYDLASYEIEKAVMWALTAENTLDADEFKNACHDLFKANHNQDVVKLIDKQQNLANRETNYKPTSKEEHLIYELQTISPKQLLEDLSSGNRASEQDLKVIREVMTNQGLPSPVMNVLIHYVLLQSNMKLSKAYMDKIASHWSRANLKTAKEAMAFAKAEKNRYKNPASNKQIYRKPSSNEVVPDWFKDRKKKPQETPKKTTIDADKEKEEIAELLREFTSNNKNNHLQG
ncbi:replication initiation and membrane attachment family protein [Virgibacillus oceani]|uniref:Replication initiation and membrane attachment protein n=1 Tax=Virgibacillus oceani TaxID=1479511 RepID=A0A917GZ09_9BACI|nr:DnaD domain protein [Virgibacillus oceani]GGG61963.1 replication initiation and membrane attachment protein [Virgibacillus oceani]